jgi:hypothetical protein
MLVTIAAAIRARQVCWMDHYDRSVLAQDYAATLQTGRKASFCSKGWLWGVIAFEWRLSHCLASLKVNMQI